MTPLDLQHHDIVAGGATRKLPDPAPPADLPLVAPPFRPSPLGVD